MVGAVTAIVQVIDAGSAALPSLSDTASVMAVLPSGSGDWTA